MIGAGQLFLDGNYSNTPPGSVPRVIELEAGGFLDNYMFEAAVGYRFLLGDTGSSIGVEIYRTQQLLLPYRNESIFISDSRRIQRLSTEDVKLDIYGISFPVGVRLKEAALGNWDLRTYILVGYMVSRIEGFFAAFGIAGWQLGELKERHVSFGGRLVLRKKRELFALTYTQSSVRFPYDMAYSFKLCSSGNLGIQKLEQRCDPYEEVLESEYDKKIGPKRVIRRLLVQYGFVR